MNSCLHFSEVNRVLGFFIYVIKILIPLIIIITSIKTFFNAIFNGNSDDLKQAIVVFSKKIVAGLVVLFIPIIVPTLMSYFIDDYNNSEVKMCNNCIFSPGSSECNNLVLKARELFMDTSDVDSMGNEYVNVNYNDVPIEYAKKTDNKKAEIVDRNSSKGSRERFLKALDSMSNKIEKDVKNGTVWKYSNKGCKGSFESALETNTYKTNCALGIVWALKSAGILESKQGFWTISDGDRHSIGGSMSEADIAEKFVIVEGNAKPAKELIKEGKIEPGDVILWYEGGHTNAYAGNNAWYDMGRNFVGGYGSKENYTFTTFGPIKIDFYMNAKVWRILKAK